MREYITLGPTPADEPCAQTADPDYEVKAWQECRRYMELLRRRFGPEPVGARISVKGFHHDYGRYFEVVVYYDTEVPGSVEYAFGIENNVPSSWEEVS